MNRYEHFSIFTDKTEQFTLLQINNWLKNNMEISL